MMRLVIKGIMPYLLKLKYNTQHFHSNQDNAKPLDYLDRFETFISWKNIFLFLTRIILGNRRNIRLNENELYLCPSEKCVIGSCDKI